MTLISVFLVSPLLVECPCQSTGGQAFHHQREYVLDTNLSALVTADSVYRTDYCPLAANDTNGTFIAGYDPAGNVDITFNVKEYTPSQTQGVNPGVGVTPPGTKKVLVKVRNATAGSSQVIAIYHADMSPNPFPMQTTVSEYKVRYTNDFLTGQFSSRVTNIHGSGIYYRHRHTDGFWPAPTPLNGPTSKVLNQYFDSLSTGPGSGTGDGPGGGIGGEAN
jgi:hypothetical protein